MTLHGHDAQVATLLDARGAGRLHHAWLLAGPQGVGKGTFARAAAVRLLADAAGPPIAAPGIETPPDHPTARLWAADSHPDAMVLSRLPREKTKDIARSITVDQVRGLSRLFATAPSFSPVRVVVVDAVDDLERPGANALLKLLEEPPAATIFFLVSHAPARLLATIRSRCRTLRFGPLDDSEMAAALRGALPHADAATIAELVAAGGGAPGAAIALAGLEIAAIDRAMDAIVAHGDADNTRRGDLARTLAPKAAQPRYEAFLARLPSRIAAATRGREGPALARAIEAWERANAIAGSAQRLSPDPQATVFELAGLLASLHQDGSQATR